VQGALARLALHLLIGFVAGTGGPAWSQAQARDIDQRAADLRNQRDLARKGRLIEFELARSGLESCRRALALADRELREAECQESQRRIDACNGRRDDWNEALERLALDAEAAGQAKRHAALLASSLPECPDTVPGRQVGPVEALLEEGRRERRQLPGFSVCESYLRAVLTAADEGKSALVLGLAQDLVAHCCATHPDYRRLAEAALIRSGHDPAAVLARVRPAAPAASAASAP
jgi:hypothetical protein